MTSHQLPLSGFMQSLLRVPIPFHSSYLLTSIPEKQVRIKDSRVFHTERKWEYMKKMLNCSRVLKPVCVSVNFSLVVISKELQNPVCCRSDVPGRKFLGAEVEYLAGSSSDSEGHAVVFIHCFPVCSVRHPTLS